VEISIRPVRDSDLETLFENQLDPVAAEMAAFPSRDREAYFAHSAKIRSQPGNILRTVVADGEVAGNIVSWEQDGERLLGYWIGRAFWGKGVATAALALLVDELTQRPLHAHVAEHNVGSIRVLEKCGFRPVGTETGDDGVTEVLMSLE
jgi:RimJ/RimL family protein N-acetyltransferase